MHHAANHFRSLRVPLLASAIYLLFGTAWIIGGHLISTIYYEEQASSAFELVKGLLFVAITGSLLFVVLLRLLLDEDKTPRVDQLAAVFQQSVRESERTGKFLLPALLLLFLVAGIILAASLHYARTQILEAGEKSVNALQYSIAAQVAGSLHSTDILLSALAREIARPGTQDASSLVADTQNRMSKIVRATWVLSAQGIILADSDTGNTGLDLSGRDYYLHHRENPGSGFFLGSPVSSVSLGTWFVGASRPITSPDGDFQGVVVAAIDIDQFSQFWSSSIEPDALLVALFREDSRIMLLSPVQSSLIDQPLDATAVWNDRALADQRGIYRSVSLQGDGAWIYDLGSVPQYPTLGLITGVPETSILQGWVRLSLTTLSVYLVLVGVTVLLIASLNLQLKRRAVSERAAAYLARYALNNPEPLLTVDVDHAWHAVNPAADEFTRRVVEQKLSTELDQIVSQVLQGQDKGKSDYSLGDAVYSVSWAPHGTGETDIFLTDVTRVREDDDLVKLFFTLTFIGMGTYSLAQQRWINFNEQMCELLGYSTKEFRRSTWATLAFPELKGVNDGISLTTSDKASAGFPTEWQLTRSDGQTVYVLVDIHSIRHRESSVLVTLQDVTEAKLTELALIRQKGLYMALSRTNHAIAMLLDENALCQEACAAAVEDGGFRFAWIGLLDKSENRLIPATRAGRDNGYVDSLYTLLEEQAVQASGPVASALVTGQYQIVEDVESDSTLLPRREHLIDAGIRSMAVFPIGPAEAPAGTLNVYYDGAEGFAADYIMLLEEMAGDLGFGLANLDRERMRVANTEALKNSEARFRRAIEESPFPILVHAEDGEVLMMSYAWTKLSGYGPEELTTIADWTLAAYGERSQPVREEIGTLYGMSGRKSEGEFSIHCKDGSYRIWDFSSVAMGRLEDGRAIVMSMAADVTELRRSTQELAEAEAKFRGLVEQSVTGIFMLTADSVIYANPRAAEILGYSPLELEGLSLQQLVEARDWQRVAEIVARLMRGETESARTEFVAKTRDGGSVTVGAEGIHTMHQGKDVVLGVMQDITDKKQAEQQISSYINRLQLALRGTVDVAMTIVEVRDPYTAGHERRVAAIAVAIAAELGLDEAWREGIQIAASLHDIGKIAVPSEFLSKPGRLTEAELALVREHARAGYDILKHADFPWPVAMATLQHHERLDGSGYPQGLRGEEILLEARVLAVADVVEAMSSHRPYRAGLGLDSALLELEQGKGTRYDPAVVDACLKLFREHGFMIPT